MFIVCLRYKSNFSIVRTPNINTILLTPIERMILFFNVDCNAKAFCLAKLPYYPTALGFDHTVSIHHHRVHNNACKHAMMMTHEAHLMAKHANTHNMRAMLIRPEKWGSTIIDFEILYFIERYTLSSSYMLYYFMCGRHSIKNTTLS